MRRTAVIVALLALTGGASSLASTAAAEPAAATAAPADVYVVQGVEGGVFDLQVDGKGVSDATQEKEIIGPLEMMPGSHVVTAMAEDGTEVEAEVTVKAGASMDVVLHRPVDPTADPLFTTYVNDLSPVNEGNARLTVAHTAVAPPADIRVDGEVLLADVASAEEVTVSVPGGTYPVDIVPTATDGPRVLGPVDLTVKAGTLTRVFAIGVAAERNMDAVVQVLPIRTNDVAVPKDVPGGGGGQGAALFEEAGTPTGLIVGLGLLGLGSLVVAGALTGSGRVGSRRRSAAS